MSFFENAKQGNNHWLLYVALLAVGYLAAQIPSLLLLPFIIVKQLNNGVSHNNATFAEQMNETMAIFNSLPGFVILMLSFVFWLGVTWLLFKPLHKRKPFTLISGQNSFRFKHFLLGAVSYFVVLGVLTAVSLLFDEPEKITFNYSGAKYFIFLFLALVLVPIQTACEEVIFRGYLMQGFALCTKSKIWAFVITSLMFGLMHSINPEVFKFGFFKAIPVFVLMGAMLGFFTILDNGIEFSWGIHFINNFVAFTLFGNEGDGMGAKPLFVQPEESFSVMMWITPILITAIIYLMLHKKFSWNISQAFNNSDLIKQDTNEE